MEQTITYMQLTPTKIRVYVEKRISGYIAKTEKGWQYRPKGKNKSNFIGEELRTIDEVKRTLEND